MGRESRSASNAWNLDDYDESLVKVPWHVHDNGKRRRVVAEPPVAGTDTFDFETVKQILKDLGYRT